MSKSVSKIANKSHHQVSKLSHPAPAIREVKEVAPKDETNNYIAVYKDLNLPLRDFANLQKKHLFIGFFVFLILGIGIMMGQSINKPKELRGVANTNMAKLIPAGAEATTAEHEHFDKICYKGEDGEQVCMTRTSQKR